MKPYLVHEFFHEGDVFNQNPRRITKKELDRQPPPPDADVDVSLHWVPHSSGTYYEFKGTSISTCLFIGNFVSQDWARASGLTRENLIQVALDVAGYQPDSNRWELVPMDRSSIIHCEMMYGGTITRQALLIPCWDPRIVSTHSYQIQTEEETYTLGLFSLPKFPTEFLDCMDHDPKNPEYIHIPIEHYIQCQWNMAIQGHRDCIYYAYESDQEDPSYFTQYIPFDKEVFDWTYLRVQHFRKRYLEPLLKDTEYPLPLSFISSPPKES